MFFSIFTISYLWKNGRLFLTILSSKRISFHERETNCGTWLQPNDFFSASPLKKQKKKETFTQRDTNKLNLTEAVDLRSWQRDAGHKLQKISLITAESFAGEIAQRNATSRSRCDRTLESEKERERERGRRADARK